MVPEERPSCLSAETKHRQQECLLYISGVVSSILLVVFVLRLYRADLEVPIHLPGDGVYYALQAKTLIDTGWVHRNPYLGAPYELELYDFAHFDNLHLAIMKVLTLFSTKWGVVLNLYYLLTFPLTTLTALLLLRRLGIHRALSLAGSLLFAFQPYHFLRGEGHLMLSGYYLLPLLLLICLWLSGDRALRRAGPRSVWWDLLLSKRFWFALVISLAASSAGHYYACFACFFFVVASIRASLLFRRWLPFRHAFLLCVVTVAGFTANLLPNIQYWATHGSNRQASAKFPQFAEMYGLKLTPMLLPVSNHRLKPLANLTAQYISTAPCVTETGSCSIGFFAGIGFLILIALALWPRRARDPSSPLPALGLLNLSAVLLATVGGFGALFSYVVNPQLHGYQRISIYLALFGLVTIVWLIHWGTAQIVNERARRLVTFTSAALLLGLGIADQTTRSFVPNYAAEKWTYERHEAYGALIQEAVPPGTMIFQFPLSAFPFDNGQIGYDHFQLYLHTHGLHWSDPAMINRPASKWQQQVSALPPEEMLRALVDAGFGGLLIDLKLNGPEERALVRRALEVTDAQPIYDGATRLFFDLRGYGERCRSCIGREPRARDGTAPVDASSPVLNTPGSTHSEQEER